MSHHPEKHPQNVPGKFYVTEDCLACENCQATAPNNFRYGDNGLTYVFRQPSTPEEGMQCRMTVDECPMEAIRDDGEE